MLIYKMESYCLKCIKYTGNIDPKIAGTGNGKKKWYYQNVLYAIVKNQDL